MELLDRYLQAVRFWLPKQEKQDIILELSEDLRSEIEEREAALGRPLREDEVADLLKRRGRPIVVASRYLPQQYLVGPVLFPAYSLVLKIVALGYLLPWLSVWVGMLVFSSAYRTGRAGMALLGDWLTFWLTAMFIFGGVTAVFAALERAQSNKNWLQDWDPRKLPRVATHRATSPRLQALGELTASIVFLGWLFWLQAFSFRLFGSLSGNLSFNPEWRSYYLPVLLLMLALVAQQCIIVFRPQWTWLRPLARLVVHGVGIVVVASMLKIEPFIRLTGTAARLRATPKACKSRISASCGA